MSAQKQFANMPIEIYGKHRCESCNAPRSPTAQEIHMTSESLDDLEIKVYFSCSPRCKLVRQLRRDVSDPGKYGVPVVFRPVLDSVARTIYEQTYSEKVTDLERRENILAKKQMDLDSREQDVDEFVKGEQERADQELARRMDEFEQQKTDAQQRFARQVAEQKERERRLDEREASRYVNLENSLRQEIATLRDDLHRKSKQEPPEPLTGVTANMSEESHGKKPKGMKARKSRKSRKSAKTQAKQEE